MKITIEMENLNSIIESAVERNTEEVIEEYVRQTTKSILEDRFKKLIEQLVNEKMQKYIDDYIENYEISVGGGLSEAPVETLTPRTYINRTINTIFKDASFSVVEESYYGNKTTKKVTFEEFIRKQFNPESEIKRHMEQLSKELKNQVSNLLKTEYDKSLQNALSGVILDVIMENEAFKNVNNNIKRLGE